MPVHHAVFEKSCPKNSDQFDWTWIQFQHPEESSKKQLNGEKRKKNIYTHTYHQGDHLCVFHTEI